MKTSDEKVCPGCENHCPSNDLQCPKGMRYFSGNGGFEENRRPSASAQPSANASADDAVLLLMRRCGHYLHHNAGHGEAVNSAELLSSLSEAEKRQLAELLKKCMQNWY